MLVSLGGDIATAGGVESGPAGGWRIHVTDDHRSSPDAPGQTIAIADGGLATSSVAVRRWQRGAQTMHHIIDPSSGAPALAPGARSASPRPTVPTPTSPPPPRSCAASARRLGLMKLGLPARLVAHDGAVLRIGDWPLERSARPRHGRPSTSVVGHGGPKPGDTRLRRASPFRPTPEPAVVSMRRADDLQ